VGSLIHHPFKRRPLWLYSLLNVALLLMLAGCFRSASDEPSATPADTGISAESAPTTAGDALPPITLIAPTDMGATVDPGNPVLLPTNDPNLPANLNGSPEPIMTLVTLAPATVTPEPPTQIPSATVALQVITPGISLGLLTPDATQLPTRTPEAEGTDELGGSTVSSDPEGVSVLTEECVYIVVSGDSLYGIAVKEDTTVSDLRLANPDLVGDPPILQIGEELQLPACVPELIGEDTDDPEATEEATLTAPEGGEIYIVRSGDVLGAIASRYGVSINAIIQVNDLTNPDQLSIGQELIIPPRN